jgi:Zn-dependent protease with chaperone function
VLACFVHEHVAAANDLALNGQMDSVTGYRGTAMHPSLGGRTASGSLSVAAGELRFEGGDVYVQMPISGIQIEAGGLNNEHYLFQHPSRPGWVLSTADRLVLDEMAMTADPAVQKQLSGARRRKLALTKIYIAAGVLLALTAGVVLLLFFMKSALARAAASRLPPAWEQQFGNAAMQSMRNELKILENSKWEPQLDVIRLKLLPGLTNTLYPINIHVAESSELNAFALPGGHIVVFTGLLKSVERPEELAGVLAHEIAHITERHVLRKMVESLGLVLVLQALFGDTSGLMALATQSSEHLLQQKFSRDFEREADQVAFRNLVTARIDPKGMIDFFAKLEKEADKAGATQLGWLASHPPTSERIERLQSELKALGPRSFPPLETSPGTQ